MPKFFVLVTAAALTLSACGNTDLERAGTGALGGAAIGEVAFDEPVAGAAVGAIGGALADDVGLAN
ncbi:hypothetical protein [Palleronia caenipelagi]|uniref:YMGG-like Gly-zipper domain-containing protein n=1 Tax=Palleronia caenipelagi TaxID=2489174 RepID=A0A547PR42_9RHOB|nr:hypothetical protein [Palleronia caenipelagi]TRD16605.1 hypothetical protein FEV53_13955 [Palleronia caenipelagi]